MAGMTGAYTVVTRVVVRNRCDFATVSPAGVGTKVPTQLVPLG